MIENILGSALILIALLALALQRFYSSVPARELKRLAGRGDHLARALYRAVAYGAGLRLFLWIIIGVSMPAGFLLLVPNLPVVISFILLAAVMVVSLVWVPSMRLTVHSARFAAVLAPALAWILYRAHPILGRLAETINRYREFAPHSHLYEKDDLASLLTQQKEQVDNRIGHETLDLAHRALAFGDKLAADILQPRKEVHLVNADDTVGPVLLDQLHQSGQQAFLVYKDKRENIIGSLALHDAVAAKQGGRVFDLVRQDLAYVRDDFDLRHVLAAFQKTGQQVVAVINNFEEFLGTITIDRLLQELLGDMPDDVAAFENRQATAAFEPKQAAVEAPEQVATEPDKKELASPEATEVVE